MRFRLVNRADIETRKSFSLEASASLYESKVAATISQGEADSTCADVMLIDQSSVLERTTLPDAFVDVPVYTLMHDNWMAMVIGFDLHFFDLTADFDYLACIGLEGDHTVVAMTLIPDSEFVMLLFDDGAVGIANPSGDIATMSFFGQKISGAAISFDTSQRRYVMCVTESSGSVHFVRLPTLFDADGWKSVQAVLDGTEHACAPFILGNHIVTFFANEWLAIPKSAGEPLKLLIVPQDDEDDSEAEIEELLPTLNHDAIAAHRVGKHLAVLSSKNRLMFYNRALHTFDVHPIVVEAEPSARVVDFQYLDVKDNGCVDRDAKASFVVKIGEGYCLQIRGSRNADVMFSMPGTRRTHSMRKTKPGGDGNIICVDPFGTSKPESVVIRLLFEAQPSMRLKRLLDNARFDEAEKFAVQYGLDLQQVQMARISHLLRGEELSDESYTNLLNLLKQIDDNTAADFCVVALTKAVCYKHIVGILDFADGLKIADCNLSVMVSAYRYHLASYRMLYGPRADFSKDSVWTCFHNDPAHTDYFEEYCRKGEIARARIVWSRYQQAVQNTLSMPEGVTHLISMLRTAISANPQICEEVAEFLEADLLPYLMLDSDNRADNGLRLIQFVIATAKSLEVRQKENYPENAVRFAQCIRRTFEHVDKQAISPTEQGLLALTMSTLKLDSTDDKEPACQLNQLIDNLNKMCHLYRVYNCRLSYNDFASLTPEEIALLILEPVKSTPDASAYTREVAFAYMDEHFLDKDQTLAEFISKGVATQFENVYLKVCELIKNAGIQCQALTNIARHAAVPWPAALEKEVERMLKAPDVEDKLLAELRYECLMALIGQIFHSYRVPLESRRMLTKKRVLTSALRDMFRFGKKDIATKLADATKIIELVHESDASFELTQADSFLYFADIILHNLDDTNEDATMDWFTELFRAVKTNQMRAEATHTVAKLLDYKVSVDVRNSAFNKVLSSRRLRFLRFYQRFAQRFLPDNEEQHALTQKLRNIVELYTNYDLHADLAVLNGGEERICMLKQFLNDLDEHSEHSVYSEQLDKVVTLGRLLCLTHVDLFQTLIEHHVSRGAIGKALADLREFATLVTHPERSHLKLALGTTVFCLQALSGSVKAGGETDVDHITEALTALSVFIPVFVDWSVQLGDLISEPFDEWYSTAFIQIARYVELCEHVLACCDRTEEAGEKAQKAKKDGLYRVHFDNDCSLPSKEGCIFDAAQVLSALASVAETVVSANNIDSEIHREKAYEDYLDRWTQLFECLSLQNLTLLEVHARSFARSLPFFAPLEQQMAGNMQALVVASLQKILMNTPTDYWLAVHLMNLLPQDLVKAAFDDLRKKVIQKRNTRATLNLIALGQFIYKRILIHQDTATIKQLESWQLQFKWKKQLGKLGVSLPSDKLKQENVMDLLQTFVAALVPASVVKEYCESFKFNTPQLLLHYASSILRQVSAESSDASEEKREHNETLLAIAQHALELVECGPSEAPYEALISLVDQLCPYSYETIGLIANQLRKWALKQKEATGSDPREMETIEDYLYVLHFLQMEPRVNGYTREETLWYTSRKNVDRRVEQVPIAPQLPATSFTHSFVNHDSGTMGTSTSSIGHSSGMQALLSIQRQEVEQEFPPTAAKRLAFHVFYINDKKDKVEIQLPIVRNEVDIDNVQRWLAFCDYSKRFSRTYVLGIAITEKLKAAVTYSRDLSTTETDRIVELAHDATNHVGLLQTINAQLPKLPLCPAKVTALRIVKRVTQAWIDKADLQRPVLDKIQTANEVNDRALAATETDYLLQENGLLSTSTTLLSTDGTQVITHILTDNVNWDDHDEIERKFAVVQKVAEVHQVSLNELCTTLLMQWLSGDGEGGATYTDPDATLDFSANAGDNGEDSGELVMSLPYLDSAVTRIVTVMRKSDVDGKAILEKKFNEAGNNFNTKMRVMCSLLRYLSGEDPQQLMPYCEKLTDMLAKRCTVMADVDINFHGEDDDLFRTFLAPQSQYRQTAEISHMLACAVLDRNVTDIATIGKVAHRLHSLRLKRHLRALLKYVRHIADVHLLPNIGLYYSRVFEWFLSDIDKDQPGGHGQILSLVYFLLGCPVEGRNNFTSSKQQLAAAKFHTATALVSIAACATSQSDMDIEASDMRIQWHTLKDYDIASSQSSA